jgi:hypothetical protein
MIFPIAAASGKSIKCKAGAHSFSPVQVVSVDFKALYPKALPGILASLPGVAHFLSFEQR